MEWLGSLPVTLGLAVTFVCHAVAFGVLAVRRPEKQWKYRLLTGTFVCLTLLYVLKSAAKAALIPAVPTPLVYLLRMTAISCTLLALFWRIRKTS